MTDNSPYPNLFTKMTQRYADGVIPWHHELPPPEVITLADTLSPGRMLDLGCGLARACIYMAQNGWQCDGVDFIQQAIQMAQERVNEAGVPDKVNLHLAPITELDFLTKPYDLILDVGCLHAQNSEDGELYAQHVKRLLKPGGLYLLFAHMTDESDPDARQWTTESHIEQLFNPELKIVKVERGTTTTVQDTWNSAWFWIHKP